MGPTTAADQTRAKHHDRSVDVPTSRTAITGDVDLRDVLATLLAQPGRIKYVRAGATPTFKTSSGSYIVNVGGVNTLGPCSCARDKASTRGYCKASSK